MISMQSDLMKKYKDNLVSVIIPVFNSEKFIVEAIKSVLAQTYQNFEIILVDDCSTDNSVSLIEILRKNEPRIHLFKNKVNSGAAISRNRALNEANGQYVAFLDSDDSWYPNKLSQQINLMINKNAFLIFGSIEMVNEYGELVSRKKYVPDSINYDGLLKNTIIATSTVVIDRNKTGYFRMPNIRSGQDYATWLQLLRGNKTAYAIREPVTRYRKIEGSLSSKKTKNWKKVFNIQVNYEGISPIRAYFNCFCYIVNAIKKYYL